MTLVQPVIMAGGKGTRLWPLSRPEKPKQFLPLVTDRALIADMAALVSQGTGARVPIIFTGEEYVELAGNALSDTGQEFDLMVLEPVGRSTAFVAAAAALLADQGTVIALLAADSHFSDSGKFHKTLERAVNLASEGQIALLGVKPNTGSTQFGYIEHGDRHEVLSFKEKPNVKTAARLAVDGRHFWNTGNFIFRADAMQKELERYAPDVLSAAKAALASARRDSKLIHLDAEAMKRCPAISLDHAVMEKTRSASVVRLDCDWLDVGSWGAIWRLSRRSASTFVGKLHAYAGGKLGGEKVERPWGTYEVLLSGDGFQVKTIEVRPGQAISLQYHHKRAEHWIVTKGRPRITVGDDVHDYSVDETAFVDIKAIHRLENPTSESIAILEIQIGDYLGEDDIVRLEDRYNRAG